MHKLDIVHRDIKPYNFMIDDGPTIKYMLTGFKHATFAHD